MNHPQAYLPLRPLALTLAFSTTALAAEVTWDDGGTGNQWETGDNWSGSTDNTKSSSSDDAKIIGTDGIDNAVVIDQTTGSAEAKTVVISGGAAAVSWFSLFCVAPAA
jgi:hypothetical protein